MLLYKVRDYAALSKKAADIISAQIILKPNSVLGLATGSTPIGTYQELVSRYQKGDLDFSSVSSANLDEYRGLPPEHDQSYRYFMDHHLFNHINIDKSKTHIPDGIQEDADKACTEYNRKIASLGGIDLQLLGLGHNGHIGFNEPSNEFICDVHCVDLSASTIAANTRFFSSSDEVPKQAYTMGIRNIMSAKTVLLLVSGEAKAGILKEVLYGPVCPQIPASVLQLHSDFRVIADEAAFSAI
ncbi:MAG: glucosamine-6-phosphate deaminase [Johnsonella sp.]|nr:glucosamine-6-phosphate deaminase [Johnsonella sp.]